MMRRLQSKRIARVNPKIQESRMRLPLHTYLAALCCVLALPGALTAQQPTAGVITGTVTDAASRGPVPAAEVVVVGTRLGTQTNDSGTYTIAGVPAGAVHVRVQRIGYAPVERSVTVPPGGTVNVDVALTRTVVALDQVVATATGGTQVRQMGTSIALIDTAQVRGEAATNPQQILAGSTPGVTVLSNSGQPGAGGTIQLRGVNSISQGNSPLIYVDGVRVYSGNTPTSAQGRQFVNPLNDIPASDIDHIEVVEGPSATTLYGTQASNGVIQIFTKHGSTGQHWDATISEGFNSMGHVGPKSDPTGLGFNECRGPNLVDGTGTQYMDPTCPASGSWLRDGPVQQFALSTRGGAGNVNYFVAGTGNTEDGVLPVGGNRDEGLRANIGFFATPALHMDISSGIVHRKVTFVPDGNNAAGVELNLSRRAGSGFRGTGCSPDPTVVCLVNDSIFTDQSTTATDHFTTGATITYNPTDAFTNRLALGYDNNTADIVDIRPLGYILTPLGSYSEDLWNQQLLSSDFASTYRKTLRWNLVASTSVGAQWFDSRLHDTGLGASNFAAPGTPTLTTGSVRTINSVSQQRVVNGGVFGQEVLAWRDLLFLNLGLRVDGNSAFGKSFGLQPYPKVSLSYVISDESFWHVPWIETLKLRAAMGNSGKAPGAFDAVRTWSPVAANNGQPAFTTASPGNPDLGPERTQETEGGFDASLLRGRIGISYTYYSTHTFGALIPVQQDPSLGFSGSQLTNVGTLLNHGNTLQITGQLIERRDVDFSARANLSTTASKAGYVGGLPITVDAVDRTYIVQGLPAPAYYGIKILNPNAFADPIVDSNSFLGAVFPTTIMSLAPSLRLWNRVTIDALGEWDLGGHLMNATAYQNAALSHQTWQPCYAAQAKMKAFAAGDASALNDVTALQRAKCTLNNTARDYSYWVESTNFFKLRSVSVSYDLPPRLVFGWRSASITLAGRNLFTSTKYDGADPEVTDESDNQFARRDYYNLPTYRTFIMSLRVGF
jgi:TonB-dependent starch-binding outer membrane protein SusC